MHYRKLDLNLLVVFCSLMQHRNVTHAARELGVTQPALSHALTRLREFYDDPLFFRNKGTMRPSARAVEIYEPLSKALELVSETFHTEFDPASVTRTVRIALVDFASLFLTPSLMTTLRADAPGIRTIVEYMDAPSATKSLLEGDTEFGIGIMPAPNGKLRTETIAVDKFVLISRLGNEVIKNKLTVDSLFSLSYVRYPFYNNIIDKSVQEYDKVLQTSFETDNIWSVPIFVSKSNAVSIIPERIAYVFRKLCPLDVFEMPIDIDDLVVSMTWHQNLDDDPAHSWLRSIIRQSAVDIYKDIGAPLGPQFNSAS